MPRTYPEAAQTAMDIQDASNISGVINTLHEIVMETLWPEARRRGAETKWVNTHPIIHLFAYKIMALNGAEPLSQDTVYWEKYEDCARIASGLEVPGL